MPIFIRQLWLDSDATAGVCVPGLESLQLPLVVGSEVAIIMREMGYTETRRIRCPDGCVAKSGLLWKPKQ
jgi:hypothetical protein